MLYPLSYGGKYGFRPIGGSLSDVMKRRRALATGATRRAATSIARLELLRSRSTPSLRPACAVNVGNVARVTGVRAGDVASGPKEVHVFGYAKRREAWSENSGAR